MHLISYDRIRSSANSFCIRSEYTDWNAEFLNHWFFSEPPQLIKDLSHGVSANLTWLYLRRSKLHILFKCFFPLTSKGKTFLFGIYLGNRLESFIGREPITWYNTKTHVTWVGSQQVVWKASYTGIYHLGHPHSLSFPAPCTIRSYYLPSTRHQHAWYSQLTVNNSHMHLKSTKEASGTLKYLLKKKFPFYNKDWRARSFSQRLRCLEKHFPREKKINFYNWNLAFL